MISVFKNIFKFWPIIFYCKNSQQAKGNFTNNQIIGREKDFEQKVFG